jgi:hypothetical protein
VQGPGPRLDRSMRTSGKANDSPMTFVPIVAALIAILALVGGPSTLLRTINNFIGELFGMLGSAIRAAASIFG